MMRALLMDRAGVPLRAGDIAPPSLSVGQVRLRVRACGVCRTDLHIVDGELTHPKTPLVLGHEVVGEVIELGAEADGFRLGDRVGVPWLGWTCGVCPHCIAGRENLCSAARFTGYDLDGGYAEQCVADARFCFRLPAMYSDAEAAPLLCAGLIGYRSLAMCGDARRIGIYGFGAAAHIVTQVARWQGREVYAFTRGGDSEAQQFATELGATWAGSSADVHPAPLAAAILFAPVGALVPQALGCLERGGRVVCGGIHMSDIPQFPYELLWHERVVCSVANLTRRDGDEFLRLAPQVPVRTTVEVFPLTEANEALGRLRDGRLRGAAVLVP